MHLEKCTITIWEINTVSPSNYRKFLGLYPNRPFSQYYSFLCRIYTSSALGDILTMPKFTSQILLLFSKVLHILENLLLKNFTGLKVVS